MPSCGATAASRTEPGVCAVPESNATGVTMLIGGYSLAMLELPLRIDGAFALLRRQSVADAILLARLSIWRHTAELWPHSASINELDRRVEDHHITWLH